MTEFVVGLMLSSDGNEVVLIHKEHGPPCVVGFWNGVGGHVEPGEDPVDAMCREFKEETGYVTGRLQWHHFITLTSDPEQVDEPRRARVYFYFARDDEAVRRVETQTDEEVETFETFDLPSMTMPNIRWMIPFILDASCKKFLGELEFTNATY